MMFIFEVLKWIAILSLILLFSGVIVGRLIDDDFYDISTFNEEQKAQEAKNELKMWFIMIITLSMIFTVIF